MKKGKVPSPQTTHGWNSKAMRAGFQAPVLAIFFIVRERHMVCLIYKPQRKLHHQTFGMCGASPITAAQIASTTNIWHVWSAPTTADDTESPNTYYDGMSERCMRPSHCTLCMALWYETAARGRAITHLVPGSFMIWLCMVLFIVRMTAGRSFIARFVYGFVDAE